MGPQLLAGSGTGLQGLSQGSRVMQSSPAEQKPRGGHSWQEARGLSRPTSSIILIPFLGAFKKIAAITHYHKLEVLYQCKFILSGFFFFSF